MEQDQAGGDSGGRGVGLSRGDDEHGQTQQNRSAAHAKPYSLGIGFTRGHKVTFVRENDRRIMTAVKDDCYPFVRSRRRIRSCFSPRQKPFLATCHDQRPRLLFLF